MRWPRRGAVTVALGVIVVMLLAACGGDGAEDDEFVRQVDELCRSANPELASINTAVIRARDAARAGRASGSRTFRTFAMLLRRASETTRRFEARLRRLRAPPAERAFHRDLLGSVGEGFLNLRRQVIAAERRDARALRDLSVEGSVINARSKGLVKGHRGFRFCGRGAGL